MKSIYFKLFTRQVTKKTQYNNNYFSVFYTFQYYFIKKSQAIIIACDF